MLTKELKRAEDEARDNYNKQETARAELQNRLDKMEERLNITTVGPDIGNQ